MLRRLFCSSGALMTLAVLAGCGGVERPKMAQVSGKVTYKGQPVVGADVIFSSDASPRVATGRTDAEGQFKLSTFNTGDGAIPGIHIITVSKVKPTATAVVMNADNPSADYDKAMKEAAKKPQTIDSELPAKYADPKESGLSRTVVEDEANTFKIDLE